MRSLRKLSEMPQDQGVQRMMKREIDKLNREIEIQKKL